LEVEDGSEIRLGTLGIANPELQSQRGTRDCLYAVATLTCINA
jgi:hypothetical protein